jgi:hypothetical protein
LCDTGGSPVGKSRRSQHRTSCRNRYGGHTNRYFAHHGAHSFF